MMELLYKRTKKGQVQTWYIEVDSDKYRTHEGIVGGIITVSEWTICKPSNVGRSNEKSAEEQAQFEVQAKWQKKLDQGYVEDIKDIDKKKFFEPMLAYKYEDYKDRVTFPCFIQPKLDGIRCIITKDGLSSRNGKPIIAAPHVYQNLQQELIQFRGIVFDGELYNHDLHDNFDQIVSCVRKIKLSQKELDESEEYIQYHIYDVLYPIGFAIGIFSERNGFLKMLGENSVIKIVSTHICNSFEDIDKYYEQFLEEGYEGAIIRLNGPYENKRSKYLLKRKEFIDEEFEIIDIEEGVGNRSKMAGRLICKMKDNRIFNSNIKGGFDFYKELWNNKQKYIGQQATIRFQNWTPQGVPRFPRCIAIRNYE